jgi:hypothetical protein
MEAVAWREHLKELILKYVTDIKYLLGVFSK